MMNGGMMDGDFMGWGGFFGPVFMIAILALIIFAIVMLVKWASGTGTSNQAQEILNQRFAAGDIDKAEYEEKRRLLG